MPYKMFKWKHRTLPNLSTWSVDYEHNIHEFTVPLNMVKVEDESAHPGISSGKHCEIPIEMYGEGAW